MALRFTRLGRTTLRRLRTSEKITEHGITAERLHDGDLRWTVNIMADGKRIHRVIGRESEGVTRFQCEEFIEIQRSAAREGRLSLPAGRKTHLSFREAGRQYLQRMEEGGGKNLPRKRLHIERYLAPFFGDQRLDSLSSFTVDRYRKLRRDAGAAVGTINREIATLSHLLGMAVEWRWLKAKPCKIKRQKETGGRIIALTDEQARALIEAAVGDSDTRLYLFVAFGLNTAMRHSEILAARYDRVDFERLRLHVPEAKAGTREQPITPELAEMLRREREMVDDRDGWIFPATRSDTKTDGHRRRMDRAFRRAVKAAGLDPTMITPHVMRHTAITNLVKAGIDLPTIQRISGHKTLAMVLRYTHVHSDHIDQAIRSIGQGTSRPVLRAVI